MRLYAILGIMLLAVVAWLGTARANVDCDGANDVLTQALASSSFLSATAFTMTLWVKSTGSDYAGSECYEGGGYLGDESSDMGMLGRTETNGQIACAYMWDSTITRHQLYGAFAPGWRHIALRLGAGTMALFVDGVSMSTVGFGTLETLTLPLQACRAAGVTTPDRLTEIKVYNVAVSDDEIARGARSKLRTYDRTTPTAYWPLEDCPNGASGNGVTFRDRAGAQRDLTGSHGGNTAGLTCRGSEWVSRSMGVQ